MSARTLLPLQDDWSNTCVHTDSYLDMSQMIMGSNDNGIGIKNIGIIDIFSSV